MSLLTVSSLCGFDLKTGGIFLGIFELFTTLVWLLKDIRDPISIDYAIDVLSLLTTISWLYGIQQQNTKAMLFNIIWSATNCIFFVVVLIFASLGVIFLKDIHAALIRRADFLSSPYGDNIDQDKLYEIMDLTIATIWMIALLIFVIQWYFLAVKYSLYKLTKKNNFKPITDKCPI
ncbi:uncharacterized protein LOC116344469 [Contarinia nasturtii]|uniref:uncharacterized protein LOC116344469 n=1 Tax=Contarinia nasturtii TaxID=265458 RepID=UPI0012D42024|nr:uncharacterized protein LOC116344469 [Contarinia nasturtii]